MFYYKYTSKSLSEVTEDCLITSLVLSSVDPRDLKENDVDVILENNYSARAPGETDEVVNARLVKIKELVMKEIKDSS
jgi:isopentenyldiphosphate isomerase